MAIEIDLSQAGRGIVRVADFPDLARDPIRSVLREEGDALATDWRASIRPGGGIPSLPGAPPHSQSGSLETSIRVRLSRSRQRDERVYVMAAWPRGAHAHLLESGTGERVVKKTGQRVGRVLPRPSAVPAAQRRYGEFVQRIEAAIDQAALATNAA